jgi:hypothetical protein
MKTIEAFFLRSKNWQHFILITVMMALGQWITVQALTAEVASKVGLITIGLLFGASLAVFMFWMLGWFQAIGVFFNSTNPPSLRQKTGFLRIAFICPIIYAVAAGPFWVRPDTSLPPLIFPFHFFAVFCVFYSMYFASKSLVQAETGKRTTFSNFGGTFILMWAFPLGIWFVQPRVNRLYAERKNAQLPSADETR